MGMPVTMPPDIEGGVTDVHVPPGPVEDVRTMGPAEVAPTTPHVARVELGEDSHATPAKYSTAEGRVAVFQLQVPLRRDPQSSWPDEDMVVAAATQSAVSVPVG